MTKTQEQKQKKKNRRIKKIAITLTVLLAWLLIDYSYYHFFYAKTEARVIYCEDEVVGAHTSVTSGNVNPILRKNIKIKYTTLDGVAYTSELSVSGRSWIRGGDKVGVFYKISNPRKCFLD